jgi:hypothetical protein
MSGHTTILALRNKLAESGAKFAIHLGTSILADDGSLDFHLIMIWTEGEKDSTLLMGPLAAVCGKLTKDRPYEGDSRLAVKGKLPDGTDVVLMNAGTCVQVGTKKVMRKVAVEYKEQEVEVPVWECKSLLEGDAKTS